MRWPWRPPRRFTRCSCGRARLAAWTARSARARGRGVRSPSRASARPPPRADRRDRFAGGRDMRPPGEPHPSKPLVLAVHGPPGVGKSYFHQLLAQAVYGAVEDEDMPLTDDASALRRDAAKHTRDDDANEDSSSRAFDDSYAFGERVTNTRRDVVSFAMESMLGTLLGTVERTFPLVFSFQNDASPTPIRHARVPAPTAPRTNSCSVRITRRAKRRNRAPRCATPSCATWRCTTRRSSSWRSTTRWGARREACCGNSWRKARGTRRSSKNNLRVGSQRGVRDDQKDADGEDAMNGFAAATSDRNPIGR